MNTDKIYAENIANEYSHKSASKVVALKKLDRLAKMPATVFTWVFGVAFTLLLGLGMCFALGTLGGTTTTFVVGIVLGVIGIVGVSVNYPIYKKILEAGKEKYASDILQLAKEISGE